MSISPYFILIFIAAIVIWRLIYRRVVPDRGMRLVVQAIACCLLVSLTAIQSYAWHRPLSLLDVALVVIGVIAVFDSLWKRHKLAMVRQT
jgi:membrane-bound metal-dependent hydrolase YbcI (DUF457 family)